MGTAPTAASPATPSHGRAGRTPVAAAARAALVGLLCAALVAGCEDLRLETPPPPTPSPDAVEVVRDATARDAVALAAQASEAAELAPVEVAGVLVQVAELSQAHADALGGVYEPYPEGSPQPDPSPTPTASPTPTPPADAATVLARLEAAAARAAADADAVVDGDLARLLGSVAVSRRLLAEALLRATGGVPTEAELVVPTALPDGITADAAAFLVASEDAAGMVWEVAAARSAEPARTPAAERARVHRERAQTWAEVAGLAGTDDDPRRSAYDLPTELTAAAATQEAVAAVGAQVEAELAVAYATLVADAEPGARGQLLDAVAEQVRLAVVAGGAVPAFPGVPERA